MRAVQRVGREPLVVRRSGLVLAATAIIVLVLDQLTKALVRAHIAVGDSIPVVGRLVFLTHARNTGAAFSILEGNPWLFAVVSAIVIVAVLVWWFANEPADVLLGLALGLLIGGAAGNLVDRVLLHYVTDFLDVRIIPVFNVADSAVVVGATILALKVAFAPTPQPVDGPAAEVPTPGQHPEDDDSRAQRTDGDESGSELPR